MKTHVDLEVKYVLDGTEWPASRYGRFNPGVTLSRTGSGDEKNPCPYRESNTSRLLP
jgi:hypothetical protein